MSNDLFAAFHEPVSDEIQRLNELMESMRDPSLTMDDITPQQLRERMEQGALVQREEIEGATERTIPGPAGDIALRVIFPERVDGVYFHIHGGAWMAGSHTAGDPWLGPRAHEANAAVVSVDYRLAPEDPYPAGPDDCEAAARWLIDNAMSEFGSDRIVFGGESAGAHLAVLTLLRLRDRHGWTGAVGAELRYGCYDLRLTPMIRNATGAGLTRDTMPYLVRWFIGEHPPDDPDVSPIFADLRDLPPALFICGTGDTLVEDSLFMWARWRAAGNEADIKLFAGAPHGFDLFPMTVGQEAIGVINGFVRDRLSA